MARFLCQRAGATGGQVKKMETKQPLRVTTSKKKTKNKKRKKKKKKKKKEKKKKKKKFSILHFQ